jgi:hypothetical protein
MLFIAAVMSIDVEVVVLLVVESVIWKALSMLLCVFGFCICRYVSIGGEKKEGNI